MAFETLLVLPILGLAAAAAGCIAALVCAAGHGLGHYVRAVRLAGLGAAAALASFATYAGRAPGDAFERVASAIAAGPGRYLATAAIVLVVLVADAWFQRRRIRRGDARPLDSGHPSVVTLATGMLLVAWLVAEFLLTAPFGTGIRSAASGQVDAPLAMLAHLGPVLAGAFAVVIGSAAVAHLATLRREWADIALPWTRVAILVAWVSLVLDVAWLPHFIRIPSNDGLLLLALGLVPLVHGLVYYRKKHMMPILTPFFGALALPLAFMSAVTAGVPFGLDASAIALFLLLALPAAAVLIGLGLRRKGVTRALAFGSGTVLLVVMVLGRVFANETADALRPRWSAAMVLAIAGIGVLFAVLRRRRPSTDGTWVQRWIQMAPLVRLGMVLYAAGFLALFASMSGLFRVESFFVMVVAPIPVFLVMGIALGNQTWGRAAAIAGALAALLFSLGLSLWGFWDYLAIPPAAFAFLGALTKTLQASRRPPGDGSDLRRVVRKVGIYTVHVAVPLLVIGFVNGFAAWTGAALGLGGFVVIFLAGGFHVDSKRNPASRTVK